MSKNFYIADLHLGHDKVIEYCTRPFRDVAEMDTILIGKWNSLITNDDDVYILGDFMFSKNPLDYLKLLKGNKHLIIGNHDHNWLKKLTEEEKKSYFVEIVDYKEIKDNDRTICMSHYPMLEWNMKHYGSIHLHGHIHNRDYEVQEYSKKTENMFNVGVDVNNFSPVTLHTLLGKQK